jgi:hypothetical protein
MTWPAWIIRHSHETVEDFGRLARIAIRWKYANWLVGLFVAVAGLMLTLDQFGLAQLSCALAAVWSAGLWWKSEHVKRPQVVSNKRRRRKVPTLRLRLTGIALIALLSAVAGYLIREYAQAKELRSVTGRLIPGSEPTPQNACNQVPSGAVLLALGNNWAVVRHFPHTVMAVNFFTPVIRLDRSSDGAISILMDVKDRDGKVIVRLDENGFTVNPNRILTMKRPDASTLTIIDEEGRRVLDAHYVNRSVLTLQGVINYPGYGAIPLQDRNATNLCLIGTDDGPDISY